MKLGPILLLNVLSAGGAVFSYHMVAGPAPATDNTGYGDEMSVDPEPLANVETEYVEEPALQGVGDEVYRKKVETLEKELASMKELLAIESIDPVPDLRFVSRYIIAYFCSIKLF